MISFKYYYDYGYYRMTVLYNSPVPYDTKEKWSIGKNGGTQSIQIYQYVFKNFQKLLKHVFPNMSWFKRILIRGFTDGVFVYTLNPKHWYSIFYDRMIWHEIGHIKGRGHTWKPTLMNPTWLFRWTGK